MDEKASLGKTESGVECTLTSGSRGWSLGERPELDLDIWNLQNRGWGG